MTSLRVSLLCLFVAPALACGASTPTPVAGGEHGALPPALEAFHAVLAPVWHGGTGAPRVEKACTNAKALQEKASPTGDGELAAATAALDAACATPGRPEVEAKLTVVHERFHALAERH